MVGGNLKGLIDALTDSNRGNDHNKLAPSVKLVQLKHGLDVNIGFARTGLHLYVKRTKSDIPGELVRNFDVVLVLNSTDVIKQLLFCQLNLFILVAVAQQIVFRHGNAKLLICLRLA